MKIYTEICKVAEKISKESKNGKPYYLLKLSYSVESKKDGKVHNINEFALVPQSVYDAVEVDKNIRLVGYYIYDRKTQENSMTYTELYKQ